MNFDPTSCDDLVETFEHFSYGRFVFHKDFIGLIWNVVKTRV